MRKTLMMTPIAILMAGTALASDNVPGNSSPSMDATRSDPGTVADSLDRGRNVTAGVSTFNEVHINAYEEFEAGDGSVYREPRTVRFDTNGDGVMDTEGRIVSYRNRADGSSAPALYYVDVDGDGGADTWIVRRSELAADANAEYRMRDDARFGMRDGVEADSQNRFFFDPAYDRDQVVYDENDENISRVDSTRSGPNNLHRGTGNE